MTIRELLDMKNLSDRRQTANIMFLSKLISGFVGLLTHLVDINFRVLTRQLRNLTPFMVYFSTTIVITIFIILPFPV